MEITEAQYRLIEHCLPTQRGNVSLSNLGDYLLLDTDGK
jgi:hypothetical protein